METQDILNAINNFTIPQLVALTKQLEQAWGVSATPLVSVQPQLPSTETNKVEQTEFTISLISFPADKKMSLVKLVRDQLGMPLKESKELVESVPKVLKDGLSKEDVEALRAKVVEAGGVPEVK